MKMNQENHIIIINKTGETLETEKSGPFNLGKNLK